MLMRTTLTLSEDLLRAARRVAAQSHRTLKDVINEALRSGLAALKPVKAGAYRFDAPVVSGKLLPGVRLDDRDALFDLLDAPRRDRK